MTKRPTYQGGGDTYSEQDLLRYISGELPPAARYALERSMECDAGLKAAVEGLQELNDADDIGALSRQLKQHLRHQVAQRKNRRQAFVRSRWWIWLTLLVLLLLLFIAFAYYRLLPG